MDATTERITFYITTEIRNGTSSTEIHHKLVTAWGEQNVCSLRHIQRTAKEIRDGERLTLHRKEGSGKVRKSRTPENVEAVRIIVEEDPSVSLNYLSIVLDLHESTVHSILTLDLKKKPLCAMGPIQIDRCTEAATSDWCSEHTGYNHRQRACH